MVHAIQLIGQAARGISGELQAAYPEIPWREMIGMRNVVVHDYADIDLSLACAFAHSNSTPGMAMGLSWKADQ